MSAPILWGARSSRMILFLLLTSCMGMTGCKSDPQGDGAPPAAKVIEQGDMNLIAIPPEDTGRFHIFSAEKIESASELAVTGAVAPDVSREVPVISLANGRVVDIKARLDDNVKKGQLLFRVQSPDVTNAFNAYQKAVNDERLANNAYVRAEDLLAHEAISKATEEQAEDAERDAKADLDAAEQQLETMGVDKHHPSSVVDVYAPISGVIISQNITNASAAGATLSGSANAFTVADLSSVWILCDVNENDLARVKLGQAAAVRVSAYPERAIAGRISDIGPVLDPSLRTAKVRIEVRNPGFLRLGMFATATLTSSSVETHAAVPAAAVLHLHDRDWVFVPAGENRYRRVEVRAGKMLPENRQEILSGIQPGQQVVDDALMLETDGSQS